MDVAFSAYIFSFDGCICIWPWREGFESIEGCLGAVLYLSIKIKIKVWMGMFVYGT